MEELPEKAKETLQENLILATKEAYLSSIKLAVTVNGGAMVVLVAFVAGVQQGTLYTIKLEYLKWGMALFVVGLSASFASSIMVYFVSHRGFRDIETYLSRRPSFPWTMIWPPATSFLAFAIGALCLVFGVESP